MMKLFLCLLCAVILSACSFNKQALESAKPIDDVIFHWFEYEGRDAIFANKPPQGHYQNPIISGFYPDPSIVRVDHDYYMVHSSFGYYPGLPVFHSKDLVNWSLIGHGLHSQEQLQFNSSQDISRGIFAPTIRHHKGLFYIITTDVDGIGNFYITANDPAGPWSKPVTLPEIDGIDPDIFFDDDGRVYIAHNGPPKGTPLYDGHRAIWLWEFNLKQEKIIPESGRIIVNGGANLREEPIWIEAPHIYKKDGWYYLSCAEGGTSVNHSQVVFRTRKLSEPFEPYNNNPILTQRDLSDDRQNPITSAGHADFVKTHDGQWWAVFLAIRPYEGGFHNTGRETYMLPVSWRDQWPHILGKNTEIPLTHKAPFPDQKTSNAARAQTGNFTFRDEFNTQKLDLNWATVLTSEQAWSALKGDHLALKPKSVALRDHGQPAFLAHRQQHNNFSASTKMDLPKQANVTAGLAIFQNSEHNYFFGVELKDGRYILKLEKNQKKGMTTLPPVKLGKASGSITLGVEQDSTMLHFFTQDKNGMKKYVFKGADASNLSTQVAGGFVGVTVGPHARVNSSD